MTNGKPEPDLEVLITQAAERAHQIINRAKATALTLVKMGITIPDEFMDYLRPPPSTGSNWSTATDSVNRDREVINLEEQIAKFIDTELTLDTEALMPVKALGLQWAEFVSWKENDVIMARDGLSFRPSDRSVLEDLVKAVAALPDVTYYAPGRTFMGVKVSAARQR